MRDHEAAMCTYAQLAVISQSKQQSLPRDRFVLLTGVEACRAGWLDVAQACYVFHTCHANGHRLQDFPALTEALKNPEFRRIVEQTERWCHHERAEAVLRGLSRSPQPPQAELTAGEWTLQLLRELTEITVAEKSPLSPTDPFSGE